MLVASEDVVVVVGTSEVAVDGKMHHHSKLE